MAYFECIIGSGGASTDIPLIVTCSSDFAGKTISCTDGVTTLTDTCPSASPYEIVFHLPNDGTWTVSGTISGTTYTESILIQASEVELLANVNITVDVYSAASDTVSYTGVDGQTHTITTDSSGYASATIAINANGSTITFTSSVANDPDNLSSYYSKAIALTSATTEVYVMPDNAIYWYGYAISTLKELSTTNGWTAVSGYSFASPTFNTNDIYCHSASNSKQVGVGTTNKDIIVNKAYCIAKATKVASNNRICRIAVNTNKNMNSDAAAFWVTGAVNTMIKGEVAPAAQTTGAIYLSTSDYNANDTNTYLYALWYE